MIYVNDHLSIVLLRMVFEFLHNAVHRKQSSHHIWLCCFRVLVEGIVIVHKDCNELVDDCFKDISAWTIEPSLAFSLQTLNLFIKVLRDVVDNDFKKLCINSCINCHFL